LWHDNGKPRCNAWHGHDEAAPALADAIETLPWLDAVWVGEMLCRHVNIGEDWDAAPADAKPGSLLFRHLLARTPGGLAHGRLRDVFAQLRRYIGRNRITFRLAT